MQLFLSVLGFRHHRRYPDCVQVISVINQKGGVGKTTSVMNLGAALARAGQRVLLIDLDPQAHLSIAFNRMPDPGDPSVYTLLSGNHSVSDVAQPTNEERLSIAPTNLDLTGAEQEFASEIGRETLLRDALERLAGEDNPPDVVVLDCPPTLGLLSLNALCASDSVVIPVQAEFFALQGMAQLLDVLERVQRRLNPRLQLLGILVGMYAKQRNLSREVVEELRGHFGKVVFTTMVRVNVRLAEAPSHGMTIFEYDASSAGAADFAAVGAELISRLGLQAPLDPAARDDAPSKLPQQAAAEAPAPPQETAAEVPAPREERDTNGADAATMQA